MGTPMGVKIINVLRDDTPDEILDLFRQAPVGEIIFVLPKNGKVFRKEEHFASFAAEAADSGKTISFLCSNPQVAAMARAYKFNVMSSGKGPKAKAEKPGTVVLASAPPPADDDKVDPNEDAFQSDVVVPSDETMSVATPEDGEESLEGFQVVDEEGQKVDEDHDGDTDEPKAADLQYGDADLVASVDGVRKLKAKTPSVRTADIPVRRVEPEPESTPRAMPQDDGGLDYIDAVWRQRAAAQGSEIVPPVKKSASFGAHGVSRGIAAGILGASLLVLGVVVWATTGSAHVEVTPVSHELNMQLTVQASDVYGSVDASFNKIPGQLFEAEKSATVAVAATGSRDIASKARGTITVYNEYSSTPQTLVATTRFSAPNGLIFRTLQSVTVPGSTVSAGKPIAGSVTVDVIADKPGSDYNIDPGKWIIAAFQEKGDAERTEKIYGVSTASMSGGANGPSRVVTQEDYDKALSGAQAEARAQLAAAFNAQAAGMKILDEAEPVWAEVVASAQPDDAAEKVSVTVTGTLKTVAFRPSDLEKLIVEVVMSKERLVVQPSQMELSYSDIAFKPDLGTLVFTLTVKGPGYDPLDADAIRDDIKGMDAAEIRGYFAAKEGVEAATVSLSPFWVRKVPTKDSRITVDIRYVRPTPTP